MSLYIWMAKSVKVTFVIQQQLCTVRLCLTLLDLRGTVAYGSAWWGKILSLQVVKVINKFLKLRREGFGPKIWMKCWFGKSTIVSNIPLALIDLILCRLTRLRERDRQDESGEKESEDDQGWLFPQQMFHHSKADVIIENWVGHLGASYNESSSRENWHTTRYLW